MVRLATLRFGHEQGRQIDNFDDYVGFSRNYVFSRLDDRPFHARAAFWQLDGAVVTEQTMGALVADRSAAAFSVAQADHITIVAIYDGRIDYHGEDGVEICAAGDLVVLDYGRRFHFKTPGHHAVTVSLQRNALEDHVGIPRAGRVQSSGEAELLHDFLRSLVRQLPKVAATSAPNLAAILMRLLALALRSCVGTAATGAKSAIRMAALAYMRAHDGQPLNVSEMSAELGLSRSSLYRAFGSDGGLVAFDRARRLRALHQTICDGPPGLSLGGIGAHCGFYDPNTLARQFRSHFGYTMSDLRDHLTAAHASFPTDDNLSRFRQAVARLSR